MVGAKLRGVSVVVAGGLVVAAAAWWLQPSPAAGQPKGAGAPPAAKGGPAPAGHVLPGQDGEAPRKLLTPAEAAKRAGETVTVRFKVAAVIDRSRQPTAGFGPNFVLLQDGHGFEVRVEPPALDTVMRLGIDPTPHFTGKFVHATGYVRSGPGGSARIVVTDLERSRLAFLPE